MRLAIASIGTRAPVDSAPASASSGAAEANDDNMSNEVLLEGVTTVQLRADAEVVAETVASKDFIPTDPVIRIVRRGRCRSV